jgi:hypothetical protein
MANKYIDMDLGTGGNDGSSWANAYRTAAAVDAFFDTTVAAGDIVYVMQSTWTLTENCICTARDGTAIAPITIIGVKDGTTNEPPVLADWSDTNLDTPATDDRPTFACAAYALYTGDYWKFYNIRFTGSSSQMLVCYIGALFYNCYGYNSSGTENRAVFTPSDGSARLIHTEIISTNGYGISGSSATNITILFCYIHDSVIGINFPSHGYGSKILFNVIDTCTTGINLVGATDVFLFGNSIYNTTTALAATTGYNAICINNIIHTATDGFKWTTQTDSNFFAYNHNYCTDMYDGVEETVIAHKDNYVTGSSDPLFVDVTGTGVTDLNFSLQAGSPCINAGMSIKLAVQGT